MKNCKPEFCRKKPSIVKSETDMDIFVVYNERRDSLSGNLVDRALIAKMTYMISR